jgi:hypothetical protein
MFMPRIVERLPVRTRLPLEAWAWALAGLVTRLLDRFFDHPHAFGYQWRFTGH